ncbi:MAPEG family protein [uncultured Shimia sp.]|uniref:MAPEG family protein n=1 Tax=uncultured Shimia sp. TaxID=573152 RepID=UPI0026084F9E|nr:MAPEG family protein [uncultured Shimia sp.]
MSSLEQYTTLSALWIAVAWLPYILDRIMVRGLMGALANYDPNAIPQSAWAQRAMRAHKVSVEAFVAFAPLAIIAMMTRPEDTYPGTLAMFFFFGIVGHYIVYAIGIPVLRTLVFAMAAFSTLGLALRILGVI